MNKVLLAGLAAILIGSMSMSMSAVAGPSHVTKAELDQYMARAKFQEQGWN
tara:strand:+ start:2417 stop:2569 length:153 start_codon:yes stop_codon:yes gene_type:complete